eukprot:TRINITY_DN1887_c0_g2_i11.p1 TRINITY_DN1887_c0_g2~~TRINITY_DN1887_c0_g2_i11.p1  ORF type:complete len:123 (-),score=19.13 TRINITY_DN1887_c0_g2_i11:296-610(-)
MIIDELREDTNKSLAESHSVREQQGKEIAILKQTNEALEKRVEELEHYKNEYKRLYESVLDERNELVKRIKETDTDRQIAYFNISEGYKKTLLEVSKRIGTVES